MSSEEFDFQEFYQQTVKTSIVDEGVIENKDKKSKTKVVPDTYRDNVLKPFARFLKDCYSKLAKLICLGVITHRSVCSAEEERYASRDIPFDNDGASTVVTAATSTTTAVIEKIAQKPKGKSKTKALQKKASQTSRAKDTATNSNILQHSDHGAPTCVSSSAPVHISIDPADKPESEIPNEPEHRATSPVHLHVVEARLTNGGVLRYLTGDGALQRPAYVRQMREMYGLDTSKLDELQLKTAGGGLNDTSDRRSDKDKERSEGSKSGDGNNPDSEQVHHHGDLTLSRAQSPSVPTGSDATPSTVPPHIPVPLNETVNVAISPNEQTGGGSMAEAFSHGAKRPASEHSLVPPEKRMKTTSAGRMSIDLDQLDFTLYPQFLVKPLEKLSKEFRGPLEDIILRNLIDLEVAWYPVSPCPLSAYID